MNKVIEQVSMYEQHDQLLVLLLRMDLSKEDEEYVQKLINDINLNWELFLGKVLFNRVNGIVHLNIQKYTSVPREVALNLKMMYKAQVERVKEHNKEINEISKFFIGNNVKHAFLKGSVLNTVVYPLGTRISNDTDILVDVDDLNKASEVLCKLGFIQGKYDKMTGEIIEASKKMKLYTRMNTHELVAFVKRGNNVFFDINIVDINFKLSAIDSTETAAALLDNTIIIEKEGLSITSLNWTNFLIQLSTHLYREATLVTKILLGSDLHLYKFYDIYYLLTTRGNDINWEELVCISKKYGLIKEVYYTLYHTNLIFPGTVDEEKLLLIKPDNLEFLDLYEGRQDEAKKYVWSMPFQKRIFDYTRKSEADKNIRQVYDEFYDIMHKI